MDFENIDDFYSELQKNIGIVLKQEAEERYQTIQNIDLTPEEKDESVNFSRKR